MARLLAPQYLRNRHAAPHPDTHTTHIPALTHNYPAREPGTTFHRFPYSVTHPCLWDVGGHTIWGFHMGLEPWACTPSSSFPFPWAVTLNSMRPRSSPATRLTPEDGSATRRKTPGSFETAQHEVAPPSAYSLLTVPLP